MQPTNISIFQKFLHYNERNIWASHIYFTPMLWILIFPLYLLWRTRCLDLGSIDQKLCVWLQVAPFLRNIYIYYWMPLKNYSDFQKCGCFKMQFFMVHIIKLYPLHHTIYDFIAIFTTFFVTVVISYEILENYSNQNENWYSSL